MQTPLFKVAANQLRACGSLLDIGCGIRPQNMVRCAKHICVEPHHEYADILRDHGFTVIQKTALEALDSIDRVDTILALDVIEHMTKEDGERFLKKALEKSIQQVAVFTPLGFMPQEENGEKDAWGFHGQDWQRHRSGWVPEEFEGWKCFVAPEFHRRDGEVYGAFFAIHTA